MIKRNIIINKVWLLLIFLGSTIPIMAQRSDDGYNPSNPSDPGMVLSHRLTVTSNMDGAGTVSGGGKYKKGANVTVKATTNTGYMFLRWTLNGAAEDYKTTASFTYTMPDEDVEFTAVYEKLKHITTKVDNTAAGTVTSVNSYYSTGANISLTATAKTDYSFSHWQLEGDDTPLSTSRTYTYTVGEEDAVLVAVFDYVPGNPADPTDPSLNVYYNVKVTTNIEGAGIVTGTGRYKPTQTVTVSTSPKAGYAFTSWTKKVGDEVTENFSTSTSFSYPMSAKEDVEFIANYYNIAENLEANGHTLTLECEPAGLCTFSIASGLKYLADDAYNVSVTLGTDVVLEGWYINGVKVGDGKTFGTYMPNEDVTLVAKCRYVPTGPADPDAGDLGYVEIVPVKGDVNGDGKVTVADAISIISAYLSMSAEDTPDSKYDINGDGKVTVADAINAITIYLTTK